MAVPGVKIGGRSDNDRMEKELTGDAETKSVWVVCKELLEEG